ncbi:class I SAM-dependent methyltransferase [Salinifilum ghardaiensis]
MREPGLVGAVAPSSPELARHMAAVVPRAPLPGEDRAPVVVEIGPGTGALSSAVAERLPDGARHVAVEVDAGMVQHLRSRRPELEVVHGDAAELRSLLAGLGIGTVDAVVSGLPWSIFSAQLQRAVLGQVTEVLAPAGGFTTFGYVHALGLAPARRFRSQLDGFFDEVVTSRTVWRNLPPARIYFCRRPLA